MSSRRVIAYWHDNEGTLVAGCDDGTVWCWRWDGWRFNIHRTVPQPDLDEEYPVDTRYREIVL